MTAAKKIAALALALGLVAAPAALANPSGSEYLPKVPKAPHKPAASGGSTTTDSSNSSGETTAQGSVPSKPARVHRRRPVHKVKLVKATPAALVEPDRGESSVIIPVGLALMGAIILGGGVLTRRRHKKQLTYQAEMRRRAEALGG